MCGVVAVVACVVWHAENLSVCPSKTPQCVHSKWPRVYGHHAHRLKTCARGARTHGAILNVHREAFWMNTRGKGAHRQFCLPKFAHVWLSRAPEVHQKKPLDVTHFQFENRSNTACSRFFQSFALPDEAVELQLS